MRPLHFTAPALTLCRAQYIPKGKHDGHFETIPLTKRNIWLAGGGVAKPVFLTHDPTFYLGVQHCNTMMPKPHHTAIVWHQLIIAAENLGMQTLPKLQGHTNPALAFQLPEGTIALFSS